MATKNVPQSSYGRKVVTHSGQCIGMCINCGKKITLCGKPFTAQIPCHKCLYINVFTESQQPVSGHW